MLVSMCSLWFPALLWLMGGLQVSRSSCLFSLTVLVLVAAPSALAADSQCGAASKRHGSGGFRCEAVAAVRTTQLPCSPDQPLVSVSCRKTLSMCALLLCKSSSRGPVSLSS